MGERRIATHIGEAMAAGMGRPDYASIRVPVLAFVAYPRPIEDQLQDYEIRNEQDRKMLEKLDDADRNDIDEFTGQLLKAVAQARAVRMIGGSHYIFISNEAEVLFEVRSFLARLH